MATYSFTFENTNPDQTFSFNDLIDTSQNPRPVGPVNHGDTSPQLSCWVGGDGKGRIELTGTVTGNLTEDIRYDGYQFRY